MSSETSAVVKNLLQESDVFLLASYLENRYSEIV